MFASIYRVAQKKLDQFWNSIHSKAKWFWELKNVPYESLIH
jgi:hypothetical protein